MNILIIGGTRNIGYFLAKKILDAGHRLTILNRGVSEDTLPDSVARLRVDRTDVQQMRRALAGRHFDMVVDTVMFKGAEAETIVEILNGNVGHYVFISTGQVYLVREGVQNPIKESDYEGSLLPAPEPNTYDYEEWLYGTDKRAVEDVLAAAHQSHGFPYTSLRLPMVNSERDKFKRLYAYVLRFKDGGPVLIPDKPDLPLRHIYAGDVVNAIMRLLETGKGKGMALNISQDETLSIQQFLSLLGDIMDKHPEIIEVGRQVLEENGFLPDCSPFSEKWMSVLDNSLSKAEIGMEYTPVRTYLEKIVQYYEQHPPTPPVSYRRRHAEKNLVPSN